MGCFGASEIFEKPRISPLAINVPTREEHLQTDDFMELSMSSTKSDRIQSAPIRCGDALLSGEKFKRAPILDRTHSR
jgi:hypothetical protein